MRDKHGMRRIVSPICYSPGTPMNAESGLTRATDPVGILWLVTGRWTTVAAAVGAVFAGRTGLDAHVPVVAVSAVVAAITLSNFWLWWRVTRGHPRVTTAAGILVCSDVVLLSWLLLHA